MRVLHRLPARPPRPALPHPLRWHHRCLPLAARPFSSSSPILSNPLSFPALDAKWQQRWRDGPAAQAPPPPTATPAGHSTAPSPTAAEKFYILAMFPYPSGALHMGHLRVYAIADVLARFRRMQGKNVLFPMGWDAFGLPAENAALERGVEPGAWTAGNVERMREVMVRMNGGMEWDKEFMTCDPEFYKHTQKIFLELYKHGLAYQSEALVNYDPVDKTVLANEQVDANGRSWRSGAEVQRIYLKQWFLKITAYKEALLDDLKLLEKDGNWPERVAYMQRHWLGKSEGAKIHFPVVARTQDDKDQRVDVFSTRPDTLFGVQYLALSATHPLVVRMAKSDPDLRHFIDSMPGLPPDSKAGYQLKGVFANNPLSTLPETTEAVKEPIPVFVAPYVLDGYGTGAVMGVPGHDLRDNAFFKQNMPEEQVRHVIKPLTDGIMTPKIAQSEEAYTDIGILTSACGQSYRGMSSYEATARLLYELRSGRYMEIGANWRLRDWLISRQRYWGTPIPIVHCDSCGPVPVPEDQLPVKLPELKATSWTKGGGNPLESATDWVNTKCPSCGGAAKRDTDTMDTFMCSSWYMFRFTDSKNTKLPFSLEKADEWMPVDVYVGGIEHAILHLLYARFISKFLATKTDLWPKGASDKIRGEPFRRLISQGMVRGKTFHDPQTGRFLKPDEIEWRDGQNSPIIKATGATPAVSYEKMSKSKHNGVDPENFINQHGADVTRLHVLFQAPVADTLDWSGERVVGIERWLARVWRLVRAVASELEQRPEIDPEILPLSMSAHSLYPSEKRLLRELNHTIESVTDALAHSTALNTCVSDLMQLTNEIVAAADVNRIDKCTAGRDGQSASAGGDEGGAVRQDLVAHATASLVKMLAPFAPAFAEECWELISTPLQAKRSAAVVHGDAAGPGAGSGGGSSVFARPFPQPVLAGAERALASRTQVCAVMENGRKRLAVEIAAEPEGLDRERSLEDWVVEQIRGTEEGARWLATKEGEGKKWSKIVVVRGGSRVNFVG